MIIIEPHIHMFSRTTNDYQAMYAAGIRACVEPSFWLGADRKYAGSFLDYFSVILDFETIRAKRFGIDHYAAIAINPKESENRKMVDEVVAGMPEYLDNTRCVALGEIGLNNITDNEIYAFKKQLLIAEEREMPVIIHLPHFNKPEGVKTIVEIIQAEGATEERIVIDHNTEDTMAAAQATSCFCGMTVYPFSKLTPKRVSDIIKEFGSERMIVNGSADWGVSDPLSLVKVVDFLSQDGHDNETVQRLVCGNAMKFYGNSPNWKPNFDLEPVPVSDYQR